MDAYILNLVLHLHGKIKRRAYPLFWQDLQQVFDTCQSLTHSEILIKKLVHFWESGKKMISFEANGSNQERNRTIRPFSSQRNLTIRNDRYGDHGHNQNTVIAISL